MAARARGAVRHRVREVAAVPLPAASMEAAGYGGGGEEFERLVETSMRRNDCKDQLSCRPQDVESRRRLERASNSVGRAWTGRRRQGDSVDAAGLTVIDAVNVGWSVTTLEAG